MHVTEKERRRERERERERPWNEIGNCEAGEGKDIQEARREAVKGQHVWEEGGTGNRVSWEQKERDGKITFEVTY